MHCYNAYLYIFAKKQGYGKFNRDIQGTAKTGTF